MGTENQLGAERQRALLVRLARVGTSCLPREPLIGQLLKEVVEALDAHTAHLHVVEDGVLVFAGRFGGDGTAGDLKQIRRLPIDAQTLSGQAVQGRRTVTATAETWPAAGRPVILNHGIRHGVAMPMFIDERPIGSFYVLRQVDRPFDRGELELLEACAAHLASAVEHARLLEAERRRSDELKVLLDVGRVITGSLNLVEILDAAAVHLARIIGASNSWVWLLDPNGKTLRGVSTSALEHREHFRAVRLGLDDPSLAARAILSRKPVAEQLALSSTAVNQGLNARYQQRSLLALPFLLRGEPMGAAVIGDGDTERQWTEAEIERATIVSGQVAVAVANARLFEDLKKSYDQLGQAQAESVKRERLAALGELSAVVAHEVRNPLGVIYNSMAALKRQLQPAGEVARLFEMIGEEAERIDSIVSDLLEFARPREPELLPESLAEVIDGAVKATDSARAQAGLTITVEVGPGVPLIPVDERMLRQALLNLLVNANQAMSRGGEVRVRLGLDQRRHQPGVRIDVADSGPGVPAELSESVFRPFVTTKATGSGLGLAVVKRVVDAHRGEVLLRSEPGRGATFSIWLPLEVAPTAAAVNP